MSTLNSDRLLNWAKTARPLLLVETRHSRKSLSGAASTRVASPTPSAWFPNCAPEQAAPAEWRSSQSVVRAAIVHRPAVIPCIRKRAQGSRYGASGSSGPGPRPVAAPARRGRAVPAEVAVAPAEAAVAPALRARRASLCCGGSAARQSRTRELPQTLAPFFTVPEPTSGRIKTIWSSGIIYETVLTSGVV